MLKFFVTDPDLGSGALLSLDPVGKIRIWKYLQKLWQVTQLTPLEGVLPAYLWISQYTVRMLLNPFRKSTIFFGISLFYSS
jgi:hypothetical protein